MTVSGDDLYRLLNGSFAGTRNELSASQMYALSHELEKAVRLAYVPWRVLLGPGEPIQDRDPYTDMNMWRRRYLARTEPTWNERLIYEREGEESFSTHGIRHLASIDNTLVESSEHTSHRPGWYALTVKNSHTTVYATVRAPIQPPERVRVQPHLMVQRVYPDTDDRDLTYFRRVYQHPSREYLMEIARQITEGEIRVWGWHKSMTLEDLRKSLWHRVYPQDLEGVTVYRQPHREGDAPENPITVTHQWLRERGEPS